MENHFKELAGKVFRRGLNELSQHEKDVLERVSQRHSISRNTNCDFEEQQTFGQRIADQVASFGGSWTFILIFIGVLVAWIGWNSFVFYNSKESFDPYPYILLNLMLSMTAALQAPIILMSQNRQAARDRIDAAHDYEVNLKAELEIIGLHEKLDDLREEKWRELIEIQNAQTKLLTELLAAYEKTKSSGDN